MDTLREPFTGRRVRTAAKDDTLPHRMVILAALAGAALLCGCAARHASAPVPTSAASGSAPGTGAVPADDATGAAPRLDGTEMLPQPY